MSKDQNQYAFVNEEGRTGFVDLDYPMMVDGEVLERVNIARLRGAQVKELQAKIDADDGLDTRSILDLFCDQPIEVIEALDEDDYYAVIEKVTDFLPKTLREALAQIEAEYLDAQQ